MIEAATRITLVVGIGIGFAAAATLSACAKRDGTGSSTMAPELISGGPMKPKGPTLAVSPEDEQSFSDLLAALQEQRVVFVGETHDRYDHHLNQLAIIDALHQRGVDLTVGMEFFQEPFQGVLDQYVAGVIDEKELLKGSEYYTRWKYDYRLYGDIMRYARSNGIPLVALNAPSELVARVSKTGIDALGDEDLRRLPADMAPPDAAYETRLRPIFEMHGKLSEDRFRRFVDVQMLWDEHMARAARDYLEANPHKTMVIPAGSGHVAYPDAIPGRLARMIEGEQAVLITASGNLDTYPAVDYVLAERDTALEPPGRIGIKLTSEKVGVRIREIRPASPAHEAGFRPGDRILRIAGEPIQGIEDVRLALFDKAPGDQVWVHAIGDQIPGVATRRERLLTLL